MARTKIIYTQPTRDPTATPHRLLFKELYAPLYNPLCFAYPVAEIDHMVMLVPGGRYPYDGDASENAEWTDEPQHEFVWRTVLAYGKMGALDWERAGRRIVKYVPSVFSISSIALQSCLFAFAHLRCYEELPCAYG